MRVEPVKRGGLELCTDIIYESGLGKNIIRKKWLQDKMEQSYPYDQIYIAKEQEVSMGVLWYQVEGMFCRYPYLHIIAVERSFLYRGYGKQLMQFYESNLAHFHKAVSLGTKLFLLVGDYNQSAQKFYQKLGYKEISQIPNLFRRGITEILMQKDFHLSASHEYAV